MGRDEKMSKFLPTDRSAAVGKFVIVALVLSLTFLSTNSEATLVGFQSNAWDAGMVHAVRDNIPVEEFLPALLPDYADGEPYYYVGDPYENTSIYHSGAAAGNPQIYQHVYAYTLPETETMYFVQNETGHMRTFFVSSEELGISNQRRKFVTLKSNIYLKGSLLFVKDPEESDNFKGLLASFDIILTRENGKKVFKGSVQLKTNKKGKVVIKTSGKIKKRHISLITENNSTFRIDFFDVSIPYRTRVKLNEEYSIKTRVYSEATNCGDGTGAEVIFGPGAPTLPSYQESGKIPEPTTLVLLSAGAAMVFYRTGMRVARRRKGKGILAGI
jgi:hypothetical protein